MNGEAEQMYPRITNPHFFLPARFLARLHPEPTGRAQQLQMALKWKRASSASRSSPLWMAAGVLHARSLGSGGLAGDLFALRPQGWVLGNLEFCPFGTGCWAARPSLGVQSACTSPLPHFSHWHPSALLDDTSGKPAVPLPSVICRIIFFFAQKPQVFGLQIFHRAHLQRDHTKHAEWPFAHPSYRIRPIISTTASYDFFLYINII